MQTLKIKNKEISLYLDMEAMGDIETDVCLIGEIDDTLAGGKRAKAIPQMIAHLSEGAHRHDPSKEAVELAWIQKNMRPANIGAAHDAIVMAVVEGLRMETEEADEDEEVDVTLEELEKKEPKDG
jgi:hypothetical protein